MRRSSNRGTSPRRNSTPKDVKVAASAATTSRGSTACGNRSNGPPTFSSASNTVTGYPLRARSEAAVRPASPDPTTATFVSRRGRTKTRWAGAGRVTHARSSAPMRMASPHSRRLQRSSQGWSQIRPRMPGRGMVLRRTFQDSSQSPAATATTKERASTWSGQAATHSAGSSCIQRYSNSRSRDCSMAGSSGDAVEGPAERAPRPRRLD
ncbi:MAG: hypothetical protein BWY79_00689 [Actinobacteria bacterium ADurb.Bin444]|nr:MAG: hypothetical protein BWY79_00689 [Actinobacteria bacterium ADurb.Bin444]